MSNTSSSPVVFRLPQSTIVFVVLVTTLGALIMLSSGIDRRAGERAQVLPTATITLTPSITPTPVDPFADVSYTLWTSDDKLVSLERPSSWRVQSDPRQPVSYFFFAEGAPETSLNLLIVRRDQVQVDGAGPETKAEELLNLLLREQNIQDVIVRPVQAGAFKGGGFRQSQTRTDQFTGEPIERESDTWLLDMDAEHIILLQAISPKNFWPRMEFAFARATTSLTLDVAGIAAKMKAAFAPPTPTVAPTAVPTAEATAEATAAATAEPTTEPTAEATAAPTAEANAAPTMVPTAAPTGSPTESPVEPTTEPTAVATTAP